MNAHENWWSAGQKKKKFINNLTIVAGIIVIALLISAIVLTSLYLGFAAMLSLAIPKLGEKLYSFFSDRNWMSSFSQEKQAFASEKVESNREIEKDKNVSENLNTNIAGKVRMENSSTRYKPLYVRDQGEAQAIAKGKAADFSERAGKFIENTQGKVYSYPTNLN